MKHAKKIYIPAQEGELKTISVDDIEGGAEPSAADETALKKRAAYLLINGVPPLVVNAGADGRFRLLAGAGDLLAAKRAGIAEVPARVYRFSERDAEIFALTENLKRDSLGAMEAAYMMKRLISEFGWTQDDISRTIGKSRPAVANTLRLLTLSPEVVGLVESGRLSAGHARAVLSFDGEEAQLAAASSARLFPYPRKNSMLSQRRQSAAATRCAKRSAPSRRFSRRPRCCSRKKPRRPRPKARNSRRLSNGCVRCSVLRCRSSATIKRDGFISIIIRRRICGASRRCWI